MPKRLISIREITETKISRSRAWIYQQIAAKQFPAPLIRSSKNLWDEADVDAWIADYAERATSGAMAQTVEKIRDKMKRAKQFVRNPGRPNVASAA